MFIPVPNFFHPGSQIRIQESKYFNPKNCTLSSGANMIRVVRPGFWFYTHPGSLMPDRGVKKAPYPEHWYLHDVRNRWWWRSCEPAHTCRSWTASTPIHREYLKESRIREAQKLTDPMGPNPKQSGTAGLNLVFAIKTKTRNFRTSDSQ
jgi:hypothetical protein